MVQCVKTSIQLWQCSVYLQVMAAIVRNRILLLNIYSSCVSLAPYREMTCLSVCSSVLSAPGNVAFLRNRIQMDRNILWSIEYGELILPWESRLLLVSHSDAILLIGNTLNLTEVSTHSNHLFSLLFNHPFHSWLFFFIKERSAQGAQWFAERHTEISERSKDRKTEWSAVWVWLFTWPWHRQRQDWPMLYKWTP